MLSRATDHKVLGVRVSMNVCVEMWLEMEVGEGEALGPTSYQENGAKETEAGDRKLEEEAAPIVHAQQCCYSNRQPGGKSLERLGVQLGSKSF